MKRLLIILFVLTGFTSSAQNFFTSFFLGSSNYLGDLESRIYPKRHTHIAYGLGLMFEMNSHFIIRGDFTYGRISGDDADNPRNRKRNLSFTSSIAEFGLGLEYVPIDLYQYKVSPYLYAEAAMFQFSPYAKDINGNLFSLYELSTEGEGFYKGRKRYHLAQFVVPVGAGFQWAITDNMRLGWVIGIRSTFTDYLDDVSKTYVDKDLLTAARGGTAAGYAYRGDELPNGDPYPPDGTQRGNPKSNDWYYFSGITFRLRLQNKKSRRMYQMKFPKSRVTCPVNVY